ncbi:hypothetical protein [Pseudomonas sp. RIT-PI-AD]|uniref:hypothetical protein n=1 Tax=Pseudomonas sp. RIT-PI-AD TaxID=3035294 RepID=UPI0021DB3210|nr:hypothetical protein [Pseudomonas sp. RIT-PI-AD]
MGRGELVMEPLKFNKLVAGLPATLDPNALYFVRAGAGVDLYVTNGVGEVRAYALNVPRAPASDSKGYWLKDGAWQEAPNAPVNLMPDNGRFAGKADPQSLTLGASFTASPYLQPFNGAGAFSSAGKFIFDNTTFGGSGGALTADVQALLQFLNRTGAAGRYGVEFYLAQITAGAQTAVPIGAGYLLTTNGNRALFGAGGFGTFSANLRAKTGTAFLGLPYYKNGVLVPEGTPITAAEGFVHVRAIGWTPLGYDNAFPYLAAAPGSIIQIAMPFFSTGIADVGLHRSPIPGSNGLNA